jgi:hypothetical protein
MQVCGSTSCVGDICCLNGPTAVSEPFAGERGVSGISHASATPHSRACALLQLIRAKPATLGVRKICRSGATPATLGVRKICRSGPTPATFGVCEICRSGPPPATLGVRGPCRSRLAGERGVSGIGRVSAIPHSRASALLQLIRAKPATLGVRKICRSGPTPATLGVRKICRSGATPATFGVREIFRSGQHRQPSAYAESVGAGLLANAEGQIRQCG